MALSLVNLGTVANDGTGDTLRSAGAKINAGLDLLNAAFTAGDNSVLDLMSGYFSSGGGAAVLLYGVGGNHGLKVYSDGGGNALTLVSDATNNRATISPESGQDLYLLTAGGGYVRFGDAEGDPAFIPDAKIRIRAKNGALYDLACKEVV